MGKLAEVVSYTDVPSDVVPIERAPTREEMSAILEGVASAAHAGAGCLKALAHLVRVLRRCPWVEGALRLELERREDTTTVHLFAEHGGARERALPAVVLEVALDDLHAVVQATPELFAPLRVSLQENADTLVFATPS